MKKDLFRELLAGARNPPLAWSRVATYTAIVFVLAAVTTPAAFSVVVPRLAGDGHAITSLNVAVNRVFCGAPSAASTEDSGKAFFKDSSTNDQTVRQIVEARWGSFERYCATLTHPFTNNENSLMLIESLAWRVAPNLSLIGIGRVLLAVKVGLLAFFCAVFLRLGGGVVLCFAIVDAACALLGKLHQSYGYSAYSFLLCVVMATIALYPLMLSLPARSFWRRLAWPVIAGVWSAFAVNMRTSYLPLCLASAIVYAGAVLLEAGGDAATRLQRMRQVAVAVLLFGAGYGAFQYSFIVRSRSAGSDSLSYHTFFHPLVLSIGLPTNEFSRREGIDWDDNVGLTLAHRVDPSAIYLTKEYEQALGRYYFGLWKRYPAEMFRVYLDKARLAGTEMMSLTDVPDRAVRFARWLLRAAPSGLWLLSLPLGFAAVATWRYVMNRTPAMLLLALMGMAATLLMIESMLIVPRYFLTYHAPLLLLYCSITFVVIQLVVKQLISVE